MKRSVGWVIGLSLLCSAGAVLAQEGDRGGSRGGGPGGRGMMMGGPGGMFGNDPRSSLMMLRNQLVGQGAMGGMMGGRGRGGDQGATAPNQNLGQRDPSALLQLVIRYPSIQEELEITEEQKAKLQEISEDSRTQMDQMRTQMREQMRNQQPQQGPGQQRVPGQQFQGPGGPGQQFQGPGGPGQQGGPGGNFAAMFQMLQQANQKSQLAIAKVLTKKQIARLQEIGLRIEGPYALSRDDVAAKINLNPMQREQVAMILTQYGQESQEAIRSQFAQFRPGGQDGGPGQPGGPPAAGAAPGRSTRGAGDATPKNEAAKAEDEPAPPVDPEGADPSNSNRGGFNRQAMAEAMTKGLDAQEELSKTVMARIGKVLTARQRANFDKLLGADFDLTKLGAPTNDRQQGGRPQPGQQPPGAGGENAPPAGAPQPPTDLDP